MILVAAAMEAGHDGLRVPEATVFRTARRLFQGEVLHAGRGVTGLEGGPLAGEGFPAGRSLAQHPTFPAPDPRVVRNRVGPPPCKHLQHA